MAGADIRSEHASIISLTLPRQAEGLPHQAAGRRIAPSGVEGSCGDSRNPGQEHGVRRNVQIEIHETVQGDGGSELTNRPSR
jgi:hypothetical protein